MCERVREPGFGDLAVGVRVRQPAALGRSGGATEGGGGGERTRSSYAGYVRFDHQACLPGSGAGDAIGFVHRAVRDDNKVEADMRRKTALRRENGTQATFQQKLFIPRWDQDGDVPGCVAQGAHRRTRRSRRKAG